MISFIKFASAFALITTAAFECAAFAPSSSAVKNYKLAFTQSRSLPQTPLFMSDNEEVSIF